MSVTKRINSGRGHWYKLDGEKCSGVTTIIGNGMPKPALMPWAAREISNFAADNLELLGQLERDARVDLLKGAHYRDRDKAARRGTEVHAIAERIVMGEEVEVPEELVGHTDSYIAFLDDFDVDAAHVEITVGSRKHRYMGTLDLIADIAGTRWLLDIKTTRSGVYPETALQLAAYRFAEFALIDDTETPMPQVERCGVVWVRGDGYDLVPVDADERVFRTFLYVQQVAKFADRDAPSPIGDVIEPPKQGEAA